MAAEASRFPHIRLTHPSGSSAEIHLYGAHLTSWIDSTGDERFFLSPRAQFSGGKSIRGGIPVVFPQFANNGPLPKHGLVRTREWDVGRRDDSSATLRIRDDVDTRKLWPHAFMAEIEFTLDESLRVALTITNTDRSPFTFAAALHNYFHVDDVRVARVTGLSGISYHDKVMNGETVVDTAPVIRIDRETDRVYVDAPRDVAIAHVIGDQTLHLHSEGFGDWVVWNPWAELTKTLADMEPDGYLKMLCVEAARVMQPVTLEPGQTWTGVQVLHGA